MKSEGAGINTGTILSVAPRVDLQSAHALAAMAAEITAKGIRFQAVEAGSSVPDRLRSKGIESKFGSVNRFTTVAAAVEEFQQTVPTNVGAPGS